MALRVVREMSIWTTAGSVKARQQTPQSWKDFPVMIPAAGTQGHDRNAGFYQAPGLQERGIGKHVIRIGSLGEALTILLMHGLRLTANVEGIAGLGGGDHLQSLGGESIHPR